MLVPVTVNVRVSAYKVEPDEINFRLSQTDGLTEYIYNVRFRLCALSIFLVISAHRHWATSLHDAPLDGLFIYICWRWQH